jgi:hypothetical protein
MNVNGLSKAKRRLELRRVPYARLRFANRPTPDLPLNDPASEFGTRRHSVRQVRSRGG